MIRGIAKRHVFIPNEALLVAKSALGPHGASPPHMHMPILRSMPMSRHAYYRADWESAVPSARRVLGVPSGLVGTIYTQCNSGVMKNPYFEKLVDFLMCMWICGGFAPCGPSALWRPKRPHLEKRHAIWQSPLSWDKKLWTFQKILFFTFMGQKWCFGVSRTGCEVADLKQRQEITTMDHRKQDPIVGITHR